MEKHEELEKVLGRIWKETEKVDRAEFGIFLSASKSSYHINEPIIMKLKVFNLGSEEVAFHFAFYEHNS